MLDAWLQQQQEALAEDAATLAPLHVMTQLIDAAARSDDTHLLLQVLMRMARIGVTPQPQVGKEQGSRPALGIVGKLVGGVHA